MEFWMSIVGISMSVGGTPQIYRMWMRKRSDDISITLWVVMVHGIAWWLYYGITIGSISLIITNSVCLFIDSIVLMMVVKYKRLHNNPLETDGQKDGHRSA
uniref:PQ loop repeat protein n=1 Tax=viral metagenome TaxID=1070528 RepID=A0A6M3LDA5_9ZZZZ